MDDDVLQFLAGLGVTLTAADIVLYFVPSSDRKGKAPPGSPGGFEL